MAGSALPPGDRRTGSPGTGGRRRRTAYSRVLQFMSWSPAHRQVQLAYATRQRWPWRSRGTESRRQTRFAGTLIRRIGRPGGAAPPAGGAVIKIDPAPEAFAL